MLAFNHLLAGSIVAVITPAPLVPVVAFFTHFALDLMPHAFGEEPPYSRKLKLQIAADAFASTGVIVFLLLFFPPSQWFIVGIGAFFGLLPDALWLLWRKGPKWFDRFLDFAHWIQWAELPRGWFADVLYAITMVSALVTLTR